MAEIHESSSARTKGEMRREDQRRLAAGEITAEELQRENALFPSETVRSAIIHFDPEASQRECENLLRQLDLN